MHKSLENKLIEVLAILEVHYKKPMPIPRIKLVPRLAANWDSPDNLITLLPSIKTFVMKNIGRRFSTRFWVMKFAIWLLRLSTVNGNMGQTVAVDGVTEGHGNSV